MFSISKTLDAGVGDVIVILANADMIFDDTVRHLQLLSTEVLTVIATSGLKPGLGPTNVKDLYERFMGLGSMKPLINRCYDLQVQKRTSWDAFVFNPLRLRVVRDAFVDTKTLSPYVMYQNGAEAAALNSVMQHSDFNCVHQLCEHVNMWHFHTEAKTHYNSSEDFVAHPYSWPTECSSRNGCLRTCK